MENRKFVKRISAIATAAFLLPFFALAYDENTTHPALTKETVDFYNYSFPDKALTTEEKALLMQGSIDEDRPTLRVLNHFFDPVRNVGLKSANPSSKTWALNTDVQMGGNSMFAAGAGVLGSYFSAPDDYSWDRAVFDYAHGDKTRALKNLGHILHLIQDATVPDHTRDDMHPPAFHFGSPYEAWASQWTPENTNTALELEVNNKKPIAYATLGEYFDAVATYSNNNFFSKDTIFDKKYIQPIPMEQNLVIGDENFIQGENKGEKYLLASYDVERNKNGEKIRIYLIDDDKKFIFSDYWRLLSRQAVLNGAGVVNLFFSEVEKEKQTLALLEKNKSVLSRMKDRILASIFASKPFTVDNAAAGAAIALVNVVPEPATEPPLVSSNIPRNVGVSEQAKVVPQKTKTAPPPKAAALALPSIPKTLSPTPTPPAPPTISTNPIYDPIPIPVGPGGFRGGGGGPSAAVAVASAASASAEIATSAPATPTPYVPAAGDIVLNEISWFGTEASPDDEWIELYNKTGNTVSLSGWTLYSADGMPYIQLSGSVAAGGYYLIERKNTGETSEASESPIANVMADLWTSFGSGLGDLSGEHLYLSYYSPSTSSGQATTTIDELDFSACGGWCGMGGGGNYLSMERKSYDISGLTGDGWAANRGDRNNIKNGIDQNGNNIRGTPRARNYANYLVNYGSDLSSGTLTLTATGSPYFVDNTWFTVASGATLTVQAGASVKFLNTAGIKVNGNLTTTGTSGSPAIFTSYFDDTYGGDFNRDANATSPTPGDWYGIEYLAGSGGTLSYSTIRYGGKFNGTLGSKANISITNASPTMSNSTVEYGKTYGIYLDTASSTISSNTIRYQTTDTPSYGIYGSGGAPTITSNTISSNSYGMAFWDTTGTISNNSFTNNTNGAFTFSGGLTGAGRISGNSGSGNGVWNGVRLPSGNLLSAGATSTFSANTNFPYLLPSTANIPTGAGLIAEAGSVWKTDRYSLEVYGRIEARGTSASPVIFTNWYDDADGSDVHGNGSTTPSALNPSGIYLKPNSTSDFLNTSIRYMDIGLNYDTSPISLENVSFVHNNTGLYTQGGTTIMKALNVSFDGNLATSTVQLP